MRPPAIRRWDRETALVAALASAASLAVFLVCFQRGEILLYGDAVAHISIARRVFDSQTPGLLQLGTVWLPLPHLLMIPFLLWDAMWQNGLGGSIPSLVAFVLGVVGVFRLVRGVLSVQRGPDKTNRLAAWIAAVIYAANPNLLYLQATAMTEALYLALFIWVIVHFAEFVQTDPGQSTRRSLLKCGLCLGGACLTRYDGWFLAVIVGFAVLVIMLRREGLAQLLRPGFRGFVLFAAIAPIFWLTYNAIVYKNPLEFANGPYSAKAIERKTSVPGTPPHPGASDLPVAATFFLKSAELNLVQSNWHRLWLALALLGTATVLLFDRRLWPLLLLWVPLPFYMLSIAYSGVPLFLPPWWPHSYYNVRYGVQLLPFFAVFVALVAFWALEFFRGARARTVTLAATALLVAVSYTVNWRQTPISFQEAWINSRTRIALETELARNLSRLPANSTILMYLGDHGGALQRAGIPLRRVIYEGNHRSWKQPIDPEGLWERTLAAPEKYADFVVAMNGDAVARGVSRGKLSPLSVIHVQGQPEATVFRVLRQP